ncbi:MAG TPA: SMP-30/gluconolactonase/LRE family protein, partial [Polyangia bacterium]
AAAQDRHRLSRFDPATGQRSEVSGGDTYAGRPFNQLSDLVVRADGNIYFSDPGVQQAGHTGQGVMAFYRLSPAGMVTRIAIANNGSGVALSPDGGALYLATLGGGAFIRFGLASDGTPRGSTIWRERSSDGLAVDCAGHLYLSVTENGAGQIRVVTPTGAPVGTITGFGATAVTNSAFGGDDHKTLFITTTTSLYRIDLNLPGFPN